LSPLWLLGVFFFVLLPFADVVRRSFSSAMGGQSVGLANYQTIFQNDAFVLAATNTIKFMLQERPPPQSPSPPQGLIT